MDQTDGIGRRAIRTLYLDVLRRRNSTKIYRPNQILPFLCGNPNDLLPIIEDGRLHLRLYL
jgi:hypothetical protein